MSASDVLIVGGGQAGATAAITLRQLGFTGSVVILEATAELPYERPPLSKDYMLGQRTFETCLIRPARFWAEQKIDILTNAAVTAIDPTRQQVTLANGRNFGFGKLLWATGGTPRRLTCPGADLASVFTLHDKKDADAIAAKLDVPRRAVVIGGGYIGLEMAAVLRKRGHHVTVLEAQERVLARVAGEALSRFIEAEHRAHGVEIRLGAQLREFRGANGAVTSVVLVNGEELPADFVITGIGIVPVVAPLLAAGAAGGNGVEVDEFCATSLPGIYAAGDGARHHNRFAQGEWVRLESVQNATDQAITAAHAIAGQAKPYEALPWFWSNQYDLRLQSAGLNMGHDTALLRGDQAARSFAILYLREGRLIALDCVNRTKDYAAGKALVSSGARLDASRAADGNIPLKETLAG
ncbi:NAD(P)/FAD-dependent oxidoreductase [Acidocella aromatica]|uniref:3-phenylpropionate/trans-cinnamate dioxygenase ferredoxin reductase subunit n=1 Tax=Acidocella aromatica TaxID=1303579 RepID=A0A840VDX4_9PROT|nr:FAD-dependent oxidoreductase [Acidocella aromatica]MBB5373077.1 3-phenylpropionate/trans-cinnamate dioxygenase ferredoxin reductase subunit [Acidocella aromatica]